MSTMFYLDDSGQKCPTCNTQLTESVVIGQSAAGWAFTWRYKKDFFESPYDWIMYLARFLTEHKASAIVDEYDHVWMLHEFLHKAVFERRGIGMLDTVHCMVVSGDNMKEGLH